MRSDSPGSKLASGKMLFQRQSYSIRRMIEGPESRETGGIPAKEISIPVLPVEVAETGNIGAGRASAVCRSIRKSMVFGGDMPAIIVECHIFAQQAVVVTKAMRKAGGDGVEQDEVGI